MLIVLMVLLMTTATATYAIHSTTMEIRSAGFSRQAMQTSYVAEGAAYAGLGYIDSLGAQGAFVQYSRTRVNAGIASSSNAATMAYDTNLLRVEMADFATASAGLVGPPIETEPARVPSLGPHSVNVPSFTIDGTDLYRTTRQVAGRDGTGRNPMNYVRLNVTARGRMAPPSDFQRSGDPRSFNESAVNARAYTEMGPFAGG